MGLKKAFDEMLAGPEGTAPPDKPPKPVKHPARLERAFDSLVAENARPARAPVAPFSPAGASPFGQPEVPGAAVMEPQPSPRQPISAKARGLIQPADVQWPPPMRPTDTYSPHPEATEYFRHAVTEFPEGGGPEAVAQWAIRWSQATPEDVVALNTPMAQALTRYGMERGRGEEVPIATRAKAQEALQAKIEARGIESLSVPERDFLRGGPQPAELGLSPEEQRRVVARKVERAETLRGELAEEWERERPPSAKIRAMTPAEEERFESKQRQARIRAKVAAVPLIGPGGIAVGRGLLRGTKAALYAGQETVDMALRNTLDAIDDVAGTQTHEKGLWDRYTETFRGEEGTFAQAAMRKIDSMVQSEAMRSQLRPDWYKSFAGIVQAMPDLGGEATGYMLPAVATTAIAGPGAGLKMAFATGYTHGFMEIHERAKANGLSDNAAFALAVPGAVLYGGIEVAQMRHFQWASKSIRARVLDGIKRRVADRIAAGQRPGLELLVLCTREGLEEVGQGGTVTLFADVPAGRYPTWYELREQAVAEFVGGFVMGGVLGGKHALGAMLPAGVQAELDQNLAVIAENAINQIRQGQLAEALVGVQRGILRARAQAGPAAIPPSPEGLPGAMAAMTRAKEAALREPEGLPAKPKLRRPTKRPAPAVAPEPEIAPEAAPEPAKPAAERSWSQPAVTFEEHQRRMAQVFEHLHKESPQESTYSELRYAALMELAQVREDEALLELEDRMDDLTEAGKEDSDEYRQLETQHERMVYDEMVRPAAALEELAKPVETVTRLHREFAEALERAAEKFGGVVGQRAGVLGEGVAGTIPGIHDNPFFRDLSDKIDAAEIAGDYDTSAELHRKGIAEVERLLQEAAPAEPAKLKPRVAKPAAPAEAPPAVKPRKLPAEVASYQKLREAVLIELRKDEAFRDLESRLEALDKAGKRGTDEFGKLQRELERKVYNASMDLGTAPVLSYRADKYKDGLQARSTFEGGEAEPGDGYAWRSMGPKEFESILAGQPFGGKPAGKGRYWSWFPSYSANLQGKRGKPKYIVEVEGKTEGESLAQAHDLADVTGIWKSEGKGWKRLSLEQARADVRAEKPAPIEHKAPVDRARLREKLKQAKGVPVVRSVPVASLSIDPKRFQFKRGLGAKGTSGLLHDVTRWDPLRAGVVAVWHDPESGKDFVVNGHHRYDKAVELGVKNINIIDIQAATDKEAMVKGALINVAEGRGTALDAANLFRKAGWTPEEIAKDGLSLKEGNVEEGIAIANLSEKLFGMALREEIPKKTAVAIGQAFDSSADQDALYTLIRRQERRGRPLTLDIIKELVRFVKGTGKVTEREATLFGESEMMRTYVMEKARLSSWVRQQLRADKKTFGFVAREKRAERLKVAGNIIDVSRSREIADAAELAEFYYDKLSVQVGPVGQALEDAAKQLAEGAKEQEVRQRLYETVRTAISEIDEAAAPVSGSVGGRRVEGEAAEGVGLFPVKPDVVSQEEHKRYREAIERRKEARKDPEAGFLDPMALKDWTEIGLYHARVLIRKGVRAVKKLHAAWLKAMQREAPGLTGFQLEQIWAGVRAQKAALTVKALEEGEAATSGQKAQAHILAKEARLLTDKGKVMPAYRRLAKETTGMADMTKAEADAFLLGLRDRVREKRRAEGAGLERTFDASVSEVVKALTKPEQAKLRRVAGSDDVYGRLIGYMEKKGRVPKEPGLRKAYLRNIAHVAKSMRGAGEKAITLEAKGREVNLVNEWSSARYAISEAEVRSGVPLQRVYTEVVHSASRASTRVHQLIRDRLKAIGKTMFGIAMGRQQNEDIGDWLFEEDAETRAAIWERMDENSRKIADTIHNLLQNEVADEIREQRWRIWDRIERRTRPQIEEAEQELAAMEDQYGDAAAKLRDRIAGLRSRITKSKPPNAPDGALGAGRTAKKAGKLRAWIAGETWGTRRFYYMGQQEAEALVDALLPAGMAEMIEQEPDIGPAPSVTVEGVVTREGRPQRVRGRSVIDAVTNHFERAAVANATADALERFWSSFEQAQPSQRDVRNLWEFMQSALGKPRRPGGAVRVARKLGRYFWRFHFLSIPRSLYFFIRNIHQNIAFLSTQVSPIEMGRALTKLLAGKRNPYMADYFRNNWAVRISQKRQLHRQYLLQEEGTITREVGGRVGQVAVVMDFVGQAAPFSDDINRGVVAPLLHQAAHDALRAYSEGEISYAILDTRLQLSTLHIAQDLELQQLLDQGKYGDFIGRYTEMKVENTHFKYQTPFRSAAEQRPAGRAFMGLITFPRGVWEIVYQNGVKPFLKGINAKNHHMAYQGLASILYLFVGSALARRLLKKITGRDAYDVIDTILRYSPLGPGPGKALHLFDTISDISWRSEENDWTLIRTADAIMTAVSNELEMFLPMMDAYLNYYENQNDVRGVRLWSLVKKKILLEYYHKRSRRYPRAKRDAVEKWQHILFGGAERPKKRKRLPTGW